MPRQLPGLCLLSALITATAATGTRADALTTEATAAEATATEATATATDVAAAPAPPRFRLPLTVGWFGDFAVHPGLRVAATLPLLEGGGHAWLVEPALGGYTHPGHSTGLFAEVLTGYRYTAPFGLFADALVGAGYLHLVPDGTVYERRDDGKVAPALNLGRPTGTGSIAASLGWSFEELGGPPLAVFVRPRLMWHAPHDRGALMHVACELGLTWSLF